MPSSSSYADLGQITQTSLKVANTKAQSNCCLVVFCLKPNLKQDERMCSNSTPLHSNIAPFLLLRQDTAWVSLAALLDELYLMLGALFLLGVLCWLCLHCL